VARLRHTAVPFAPSLSLWNYLSSVLDTQILEDGLAAMKGLIARDELSPHLHRMFAILLTSRQGKLV